MRKSIILLTLLELGVISGVAFASAPIAMSLSPDPTTGPFFAIHMSGSAFRMPLTIPFDTEGRTLIVPEGCINQSNVTIIDANTKDEWGNPAEIVTGQVTLTSADGSRQYTVDHLPFFVDKGQDCASGFKNFGASMNAYYPGNNAPCLGNFFSYYNYGPNMTPGYTIRAFHMANTHSASLILGKVTPGTFNYQLPYRSTASCIGNQTVPVCYGYQHWGTSIPGVTIVINGVHIPEYEAMIDTGGGMMIIRDDKAGTYTKALQSVLQPCPTGVSFIQNCQCLNPEQMVKVSISHHHLIPYHYSSTTFADTQESAVAICPNSVYTPNSPNSYVFAHGVNLGFNFFNFHHSVSYNINTCTLYAS